MKAKITRGRGFRGVLDYAIRKKAKEKKPEIVGGNMMGRSPRELSSEFGESRSLRPEIEKPVWHCSLSLPEADGRIANEKWGDIVEDLLTEIGLHPSIHQYVVVRHKDKPHDHVHVIASRIGMSGALWLGQFELKKTTDAVSVLEKKYGLTITPRWDGKGAKQKTPKAGEIGRWRRTGEAPIRARLQMIVDEVVSDKPRTKDFVSRLQAAGVAVSANIAKNTDRMNGFSFSFEGVAFKASQLGKKYSWKYLQEEIAYEHERDIEILRHATNRARTATDSGRVSPCKSDRAEHHPGINSGDGRQFGVGQGPELGVGPKHTGDVGENGTELAGPSGGSLLSGQARAATDHCPGGQVYSTNNVLHRSAAPYREGDPSIGKSSPIRPPNHGTPAEETVRVDSDEQHRECDRDSPIYHAGSQNILVSVSSTKKSFLILASRCKSEQFAQRDVAPRKVDGFESKSYGHFVEYYRLDIFFEHPAFIDYGNQIEVHAAFDDVAVLAALRLGIKKWGTVSVDGDDEFKSFVARIAGENNISLQDMDSKMRDIWNRHSEEKRLNKFSKPISFSIPRL